jgi:hypothetical protein
MRDVGRLGGGLWFEDLAIGTRWRTAGRTLTEADLVGYVNLTWFTELGFARAVTGAKR